MKITRIPVRLIVVLAVLAFLWGSFSTQPLINASAQDADPAAPTSPQADGVQSIPCSIFPANNIWNMPVDELPVDPHSNDYITSIGPNTGLHPDFGSGTWDGAPIGIPYNVVSGSSVTPTNLTFEYDRESDAGPYPFPQNPLIEGGTPTNCSGDCHVLVVDKDNCKLYETWDTHLQNDGTWTAGSGAIFDLTSNTLRHDQWTSADAAGLPILPGLVRYDEVASGQINHALRFTVANTRNTYVWPARHQASDNSSTHVPPMGQRFRLKSSFDITGYPKDVQVILQALKTYGMIVADNGANWYISGAPDENWNNDTLHRLGEIKGSNFEAVDASVMQVSPNSAEAQPPPPPVPGVPGLTAPANAAVLLDEPTFNWSLTTPAAVKFEIQISTKSDFSSIIPQDNGPTSTSYNPKPELTHNQKYYWRVRGVNSAGVSGNWTKARSFSIAPEAPDLLLPKDGDTPNSLRPGFDWSDSSNSNIYPVRYQIVISKDETFHHLVVRANTSTSSWYAVADLPPAIQLWWRVRSASTIGSSSWSGSGSFTSPFPPSIPGLLLPKRGAAVGNFTPTLDWRDSTNSPNGYQVQIAVTQSGFETPLLDKLTDSSTFTVPDGLLSGGVYYWRVRSYNNINTHQYSSWSAASYFRTPAALKGTAHDALTKTPLSGLTVTVDGTTLSATTDKDGQYLVLGVPAGSRRLQITGNGYYGAGKISAVLASTQTLDFTLARKSPVALPPTDSLYHGVYPGGKTGEEDDITLDDLHSYELTAGKTAAWVYFSHNWYHGRSFPLATATWIRDSGSIPYIRLMLRSNSDEDRAEPKYTLSRILRGDYDKDLRAWARSARDFGTPIIVEFGTEMNGEWFSWNGVWNGGGVTTRYGDRSLPDGPERFRDTYRRIIQICREEGAGNITWVFHVNYDDQPDQAWNHFENYYPGDDYIDWIGVSVYGAQTPMDQDWPTFRDLLDAVYPRLEALSTDKPIVLAEFGVTANNPNGNQIVWADNALGDLTSIRWPRIIGFSWWNEAWQNDDNPQHDTTMRLQDNAGLAAVFVQRVGNNSKVLGRLSFTSP